MKPIKLEDIKKNKQPFTVPEGYFEDLPMKIQGKVQSKKKRMFIYSPVFQMALAAAASIVIVISLVFTDRGELTPESILAEIPQEELLAYVNQIEFSELEILTAFEATEEDVDFSDLDGLEGLELEEELDDVLLEYDLSDDYLIDENKNS